MRKKGKHNFFLIVLLASFAGSNAQQGFLKSAAIDSVPAAGFYQLNLLPNLAAYLQPDMRDIRIVDNTGKQIPYLLKSDLPVFRENKFTALPMVSVKKEADQQTHIVIENTLHHALEQLLLIIKNTDAGRLVTLSGSDDNKSWFVIKENIYLDKLTSNNSGRFIKSLVFPLSNYHYFKIIISGKDVIPFNLVEAGVYEEIIQNGKYLPLPSPVIAQKDSIDKYSYISVQLNNSFFVDRLVIDVHGPKFYNRQAEIYSGSSNAPVFMEQFMMRSDRENIIQLAVKTNRLLLKIRNNDNPPLQVTNIHAFQLNRFLLAYIEKNKSCQLLFEDSTATAPDYDLEVFKDSISGNASLLQYGAIKKNTPAEKKLPLTGAGNKVFIWMAIGFAITILLLLTYKLTGEIKNKP